MRIRVLYRTAIAGFFVLAMVGCQGDFVGPDDAGADTEVFAKGDRGGGGGGGGGNGGSDKQKGDLYADLMIILRDANGVPIVYPEQFTDERGNPIWCVQPVTEDLHVPHPDWAVLDDPSAPLVELDPVTHAVDGKQVTLVPIYAQFQDYLPVEEEEEEDGGDPHATVTPTSDDELVVAPGPCDIILFTEPVLNELGQIVALDTIFDYGQYAHEVELERLNMARAPNSVLTKQMDEVQLLFAQTDPYTVTLDPAGRPVFDGTMVDAMPKLQGIRESLLETGGVPGADPDVYGYPFQLVSDGFTGWTTWDLSAFALGGSASKFGEISIDAVSYHDRVMSIPMDGNFTWADQDGVQYLPFHSTELNERFVNYSGVAYTRGDVYPGCITYSNEEAGDWTYVDEIVDLVAFRDLGPGVPATSNIAGYAQMADDARAVIFWIHEHEALIKYADPVGVNSCATQRDWAAD